MSDSPRVTADDGRTSAPHPHRRRHLRARRQRRRPVRRATRRRTRRARTDVHVMAPAASRHGVEGGPRRAGLTAHRLYSWRWYPHDWLRFALPWRIKQNSAVLDQVKPDVVHFQSTSSSGGAVDRGREARHPHHRHQPLHAREHARVHAPSRSLAGLGGRARVEGRTTHLRRAESVTTPTRQAADFLERFTGLRGVHAISCGIDAHNYFPNWQPRTENRIIFVGRVTGSRSTCCCARSRCSPPSSTSRSRSWAAETRSATWSISRASWASPTASPSPVRPDGLREAYHRASVLAMPSIAELQSIVTMEAMASALPVVAANAMALPHLVHDGENGYLFARQRRRPGREAPPGPRGGARRSTAP